MKINSGDVDRIRQTHPSVRVLLSNSVNVTGMQECMNCILSLLVLDLGCGPGLMSERILDEFPNVQITLFDLTSEMIEACRLRFGGSSRIKYQVGDFRIDDFNSGYDVILASLSLHHLTVPEGRPFAERIYKSLVPDGCLITAEVIVDESPDVRELRYELWRRHMVVHGEDGSFWYEKRLAKDHPVEISSWVSILQRTGFVSVGCFWRYLNFAVIGGRRPAVVSRQ